jgi:predicted phage terminase large subunit-like protein
MKSLLQNDVAIDRELGLRGRLVDYVELCWPIVEPGSRFVGGWHIDNICDHLEATYKQEISNLVINVPPGCSKSLLACVFWPTWCWLQDPGLRWIFGSFDNELTLRDAARAHALITSDWHKARWGDRLVVPSETAMSNYETQAKGFRFATSVMGKATGRHGDCHVIDDPTKPKDVTPAGLKIASDWRRSTLASRFRSSRRQTVLIMQRLHCADLAQEMIDEGAVHLRLPMEFEPKTICETKWGRDERTEEGELLCPARFDAEAVASMKKAMGTMVSSAQLQQRPVPEGGSIFKSEWLQNRWKELPASFSQTILSWDCAFKDTDGSDFVVGQVWGVYQGRYYLLDQAKGKWDFVTTLDRFEAQCRKWPKAMGKLVEDKANGTAVINMLKKKITGLIEIQPEGGKESRASAVSPLFEAGNVVLPDPGMPGFSWVDEYVSELTTFPMAAHDDQVDATTQALNYLHQKTSRLKEAMDRMVKDGLIG